MKFEVLTGQDAEDARKAGAKLQSWWAKYAEWRDRDLPHMECETDALYRIKPQPKTIRVPLPDLRVLAGSMLADEDGELCAIKAITPDGKKLLTINNAAFTAQDLVDWCYYYAIGFTVKPCWTEEVEG